MSGDDELDNTIDNLIEQYLLFLRGRGAEPDLSVLPPGRRAEVTEQLTIVAALAGRDTEVPPIEDDPVAVRLGLVSGAGSSSTDLTIMSTSDGGLQSDNDPVRMSLRDLAFRFNQQILLDFVPAWASQAPVGMEPIAQCTALGETVAVFIGDVENWSDEPDLVARFFRQQDSITAVALVTENAEDAVVITAADAQYSISPIRGWLPPHNPSSPEPLNIALGRHFDRCLPEWERMADLDELLGLGDLDTAATEISSAQVAVALRAKPRLAHKKESLQALRELDPATIAGLVVEVQSGRLAGDELIGRVARLAKVAEP